MSFTSLTFLLAFLPLVCGLYYLFSFARPVQNIILLAASLVFYAWGAPLFVILLLVSILLNYLLGLMADAFRVTQGSRGTVIVATVFINVALLLIFKWLSTMQTEIGSFFGVPSLSLDHMTPIGASFFTFQAISYVIDVLRGTTRLQKNPLKLGLYIAFFPQIIAGPVIRHEDFAAQLASRRGSLRRFSTGACRFIVGMAKKILIADVLTSLADRCFALDAQTALPLSLAWLGAAAFALGITFYFSAYSDMAIGLALMFGFKYEENMRYPWAARSVEGFWRRFHISLLRWAKDYLVSPVATRQRGARLRIRDLILVWLLIAVWLGLTPTLVAWSLFNLLLILLERALRLHKRKGVAVLRTLYVAFVMVVGFVLFRAATPEAALHYLAGMFGLSGLYGEGSVLTNELTLYLIRDNALTWVAALVFATPLAAWVNGALAKGGKPGIVLDVLYPFAIAALLLVCLLYITVDDVAPLRFFAL